MPDYDAIVVGGRAAGASTALLLARAGLSVLVLDRGRLGGDTLSTHALMRGAVLQLTRWGVPSSIVGAATPAIRHVTFHYADGIVPVELGASHGVDALYAPRRTVLDPALVAAAASAGAEFGHCSNVVGVRRDGERVTGVEYRHGSRTEVRTARIVVGADGRRSRIADLVGAGLVAVAANTSAFIYGYWEELEVSGYEWAYGDRAAAGFIPTNDSRTCVFVGADFRRIGRDGPGVVAALTAAASPSMSARLREVAAPARLRTFPGQAGYLRSAWGPGWALVGDAGSWKDPISAHGLTDALRDAELLARALVVHLRDGVPEKDSLGTYQAARNRLALPMLRIADRIATYRWGPDRIRVLLGSLNQCMRDEVGRLAGLDPT